MGRKKKNRKNKMTPPNPWNLFITAVHVGDVEAVRALMSKVNVNQGRGTPGGPMAAT